MATDVILADRTYQPTTSEGIITLADADFALISVIDSLITVLRSK